MMMLGGVPWSRVSIWAPAGKSTLQWDHCLAFNGAQLRETNRNGEAPSPLTSREATGKLLYPRYACRESVALRGMAQLLPNQTQQGQALVCLSCLLAHLFSSPYLL